MRKILACIRWAWFKIRRNWLESLRISKRWSAGGEGLRMHKDSLTDAAVPCNTHRLEQQTDLIRWYQANSMNKVGSRSGLVADKTWMHLTQNVILPKCSNSLCSCHCNAHTKFQDSPLIRAQNFVFYPCQRHQEGWRHHATLCWRSRRLNGGLVGKIFIKLGLQN